MPMTNRVRKQADILAHFAAGATGQSTWVTSSVTSDRAQCRFAVRAGGASENCK